MHKTLTYHRWVQPEEPVASLDPKSASSLANKGAAVASVEVDYALLSDALKKAANWQEVEQLVERDSSRLTFAVKEWTPVQKNSLRDLLTSYVGLAEKVEKDNTVEIVNFIRLVKCKKKG